METDWGKEASAILKAELTRRNISYEGLRLALAELGIEKTTHNLTKTINLGRFSFAFFLQCAEAIGLEKLQIK
jgi:hypothetical protein